MVELGWSCQDFRLAHNGQRIDIRPRIDRAMQEAERYLIAICLALQNISSDAWLQRVYQTLFGRYENERFIIIQREYMNESFRSQSINASQMSPMTSCRLFTNSFPMFRSIAHIL